MTVHSGADVNPERDAFIRELLDRAAQIRMPELFAGHPDALWHVPNRNGVSVTVVRTPSLTQDQLVQIMRYRLVQYVLADQLDTDLIYRDRLTHEPLDSVSERDIHILAGDAETGEILCYSTIEALRGDTMGATLRTKERPLFPVERVFGWGIFNRLKVVPDLPLASIREAGRLAKNHQCDPQDERVLRAPVELLLAWTTLLSGQFLQEFEVSIGDIEEGVAKKSLDFFHLPLVVLHGVVPYATEGSYGFLNYQTRARYPFALLSADIPKARLAAIEAALALPGKEGIIALLELKKDRLTGRSSLASEAVITELTSVSIPQQGGAMLVRRQLLDRGDWLRKTSFFRDLSVAESAVLGTFMERCTAAEGDVIVRQGETGDDLYLIETGRAEVRVIDSNRQRTIVAELGPGDCFGEIALVTGGERTADVIALTPMTLMRLSHDAYARYLAHLVDVDNQITHTALTRTRDTLRAVRGGEKAKREGDL